MFTHHWLQSVFRSVLKQGQHFLTETDVANARDLVDHNEFGAGLELISTQLEANGAIVPVSLLSGIQFAAIQMQMPASTWNRLIVAHPTEGPVRTSAAEAHEVAWKLFAAFADHPRSHHPVLWESFESYVTKLTSEGWTRKDVYDLVYCIDTPSQPEEGEEAAGEYLSWLIGWVHYDGIRPFPGEPQDHNELVGYVVGNRWWG